VFAVLRALKAARPGRFDSAPERVAQLIQLLAGEAPAGTSPRMALALGVTAVLLVALAVWELVLCEGPTSVHASSSRSTI